MIPVIYLDMDGVLSDIEHGIQERYGFVDLENERSKFFKSYLPDYVEHNGFADEQPCSNAHKLVDFLVKMQECGLIHIAILTSCGQFYQPASEVVHQKKKFLEKNFPALQNAPFCVTTSGADKAKLAHPFAILIDDHIKNCEKFQANGGNAFHYKDCGVDEILTAVENLVKHSLLRFSKVG